MSDSSDDVAALAAGGSDARFARLERDFDAVMSARTPAFGAARNLLSLLLSANTTRPQLEAAARTAHLATGDLWDALARLNEKDPK